MNVNLETLFLQVYSLQYPIVASRTISSTLRITRSPLSNDYFLTTAIVGIGLNRSVDFAQAGIDIAQIGNPISLHQVSKEIPTEFQLLSVLRDRLIQSLAMKAMMKLEWDLNSVNWLDQVRSRDALLGRKIQFETPNGLIVGISEGINDRGELLIKNDNGVLKAFNSGRILTFF